MGALCASAFMRSLACLSLLVFAVLRYDAAAALDRVDPYICPTAAQGTGIDCFLEAVPQTYTMCRQIKSIEIIEFGLKGAQEGVNGAKTEYCIDKHRLLIVRPYQAALREAAKTKETVQRLRELYDAWLASLAKLVPAADETEENYKQRVVLPYADFNERIGAVRAAYRENSSKAAAAPAAKRKKSSK
jgi:hypothetical protein